MPAELKATARWIHRSLMKMDWVSRHEQFFHLREALTIGPLRHMIAGFFSPDDLLAGTCTGSDLPIPVIILADRIPKQKRQLTIDDFFVKKARP